MRGIHIVNVRRQNVAGTQRGIALIHAKILYPQSANRRGHPAILIAMIVHSASLPDFPANGHTLEHIVLENKIASVIGLLKKQIFVERFNAHGVRNNVVLHVLQRKIALGYGRQAFHPVRDGQRFRGRLLVRDAPPKSNSEIKGLPRNYNAVSSVLL
jgi:hypothetical protein